jgi:hypothetical protein
MRRFAAVAVLSLLFAVPMAAQSPQGQQPAAGAGAPPGGRRFQPPPDHWMTIDSLTQAVGLNADQRTKVTPAYTALNGVMKDAAAKRQAFRQKMQASGFQFGQEPTPEMRAQMDSARSEMDGFQAEADQWYAAIRNNLTPAQQTKFDALPKPQVAFRRSQGAPSPQ